jgi:hypothetical protein
MKQLQNSAYRTALRNKRAKATRKQIIKKKTEALVITSKETGLEEYAEKTNYMAMS